MDKSWEIVSSTSKYDVLWDGDFSPESDEKDSKAREIWEKAVRKQPGSYVNGQMLAFRSVSIRSERTLVHCVRSQYMYYFAQHKAPELNFGIRPVCVSGAIGITTSEGPAFVIARRGKTVTQYSGYFELIPSGGLDGESMLEDGRVDFISQLRREFVEETGVGADAVRAISPFALIRDVQSEVFDICALISIDCAPGQITSGISKSGEYSDVVIVPRDQVKSFVRKHKNIFVPTSLAIMRLIAEKTTDILLE